MSLMSRSVPADDTALSKPRIEILTSEAAWQRLPEAVIGQGAPLPNWARATAATLPYTTAAMLELDWKCRTTDQFSARERGLIRLAAATVNHSAYGTAYARHTLESSGLTASQIAAIESGDLASLDDQERRLVKYAEQASRAARDLTDDQVAALRKDLGDDRLVGLVLLTGYANFQDRLLLALAIPLEDDGPIPPSHIEFKALQGAMTPKHPEIPAAERPPLPAGALASNIEHPDWTDFPYQTLQERLEKQRERDPRIAIPTFEELMTMLPEGTYKPARPLRIRWSRLVMGRQPKIGPAWMRCLRAFSAESKEDGQFEESVFWVVTRDLRCFYCMGHCEMILEVNGLDRDQVADRTRRIADGDWKDFTPAEQATFAIASKMTRAPWTVSDADVDALKSALGPERAIDALWWIARCQFMTKVSDTFQLQLERDNVFQPPKDPKK
jgi:alkylhydroperoxidase family enzyme